MTRILLRLAAVTLIVTQLAGFTCYSLDSDNIEYAPGYGYVVTVERMQTYGRDKEFYFTFDTLEQAQEFVRTFPANPANSYDGVSFDRIPKGYKAAFPARSETGREIAKSKGPRFPRPDAEAVNLIIDRATPPLPTGPQPQ